MMLSVGNKDCESLRFLFFFFLYHITVSKYKYGQVEYKNVCV